MEEELSARLGERQKTEFVEDDEVTARQIPVPPTRTTLHCSAMKLLQARSRTKLSLNIVAQRQFGRLLPQRLKGDFRFQRCVNFTSAFFSSWFAPSSATEPKFSN